MSRKDSTVLALLALALLLTTGSALAERIRCGGGKRTGTNAADVISGSLRADQIFARDGDDEATATAGDALLSGGQGADLLVGESGNDRIDGGANSDRIVGGGGTDKIIGGGGDDAIDAVDADGFPERDVIDCGSGKDWVVADSLGKVAGTCETLPRVIVGP